jgi:hypothetical protein
VHPERLPRFIGCFVLELDGRVSERDLPPGTFDGDCTFDMFADRAESTDAILDLDMPLGAKVVLTILRKVYLQRGSGRRETALRRGLDVTGQRLVPGALRLLKSEGLITSYPRRNVRVWQPVRTHSARVGLMVTAPATSRDPLLSRAAEL